MTERELDTFAGLFRNASQAERQRCLLFLVEIDEERSQEDRSREVREQQSTDQTQA